MAAARLSRRRAVVDYFHRSKARQVGHARVGACQLDRCRCRRRGGGGVDDVRRTRLSEAGGGMGVWVQTLAWGGDGVGGVVFGSGL